MTEFWPNSDVKSSNGSVPRRSNLSLRFQHVGNHTQKAPEESAKAEPRQMSERRRQSLEAYQSKATKNFEQSKFDPAPNDSLSVLLNPPEEVGAPAVPTANDLAAEEEKNRRRVSAQLKMKMGFSAKVVDDAALNEYLRSRTDTWGALGALLMTRGGSYSPENAFFSRIFGEKSV